MEKEISTEALINDRLRQARSTDGRSIKAQENVYDKSSFNRRNTNSLAFGFPSRIVY